MGTVSTSWFKGTSFERNDELRLEDYIKQWSQGHTSSNQDQLNQFQQPNTRFSPSAVSVPISQSSSASPFGSTGALFGTSPTFGSSDDKNVHLSPSNFASGASSTTIFGVPINSGSGFKSSQSIFQSNSEYGGTNSIFGVPNVPSLAPGSATNPNTNSNGFQFSTTTGHSFPSFCSTPASPSRNLFGPQSASASSTASFSFSAPSVYSVNSGSTSGGQSKLGIQNSSGSQRTTTQWVFYPAGSQPTTQWGNGATTRTGGKGSSVAPYSVTQDIDGANAWRSLVKIQSISAMPVYKDKSQEELRMEDYESLNKGRNTPCGVETNIFNHPPMSNFSSIGPFFNPIKSNSSCNSQAFVTSTSTIHAAPEFTNPMKTFSWLPCNLPPQSQSFQPQSTVTTSTVAFTPTLHQFSQFSPFSQSTWSNNCQVHPSSTACTSSPFSTSSSSKLSCTFLPTMQANFQSQSTTTSSMPGLNLATNLFSSLNPLTQSVPANDCKFPPLSTLSKTSPFSTLSSCKPPFNIAPSIQSAFQPQNTVTSSMPAYINPSSLNPFSQSLTSNNSQLSQLSTAFTFSPLSAISSTKPPSPITESTAAFTLGRQPSFLNASQPGQIDPKVSFLSTSNLNEPTQAPSSLTKVTEVGSQNINGKLHISSSAVNEQQSIVMNPFGPRTEVNISIYQPDSRTSGISSITVSNNFSPPRRAPLLRIHHLSLRRNKLSAQRHESGSSEPKVPFFVGAEDSPCAVAPLMPRMNPRSWVLNPFSGKENTSLHTCDNGNKSCEHKVYATLQPEVNSTVATDENSVQGEELPAISNLRFANFPKAIKEHDNVLLLMPKLGHEDYYTEPPINFLAEKERAEPGFCSHVHDFVVGRRDYGSIKFLGETDVRHLDLESIVQFNYREVIVYANSRQKPPVGQCLNKPAEVTLLNVRCIDKKTGTEYTDGVHVHKYKQMLIKKTEEQGAEFISYDPVQGEWKFRVHHF